MTFHLPTTGEKHPYMTKVAPKMYRNDGFHPIKKVFLLGK